MEKNAPPGRAAEGGGNTRTPGRREKPTPTPPAATPGPAATRETRRHGQATTRNASARHGQGRTTPPAAPDDEPLLWFWVGCRGEGAA